MKFFDEIVKKYELKIPRRNEENADSYIDWNDYNYPSFFPLIHYNPDEIRDKEKTYFVDVPSSEPVPGTHSRICLLLRLPSDLDICVHGGLDQMGRVVGGSRAPVHGPSNRFFRFLQRLLWRSYGQRLLDVLQVQRNSDHSGRWAH